MATGTADIEKIVKIVFAGDDSNLGKTINSIGGGMDTLGVKLKGATQPLADFSDAVLKIDAVLGGIAAGALVLATSQAGKFGDSFNEIATLIDAPTAAIDQFRSSVLNYSRDSGASLDAITGATYNIISATGDWETALDRLSVAERLNTAGKGELNDTAKILATSMNAYGAASGEASDYADTLFTTVRIGVTTLGELSGTMGNVTGLAANAGVSFADLSAAVGALTGTVGDTSLSVTQIKSLLTAILAPSEGAKKAAKDLGIEFNQTALEAMGLHDFLQMVYTATGGNAEIMKTLIPRVEGVNAALVLGGDASGKYAAALEEMANRTGAVATAYDKMADNFGETNQKIINNFQATLVEVGTPLLDEWGAIADGIINIFKGVSIGFDAGAFDPLMDYIQAVGRDMAEELTGIAGALPQALEGIEWTEFIESLESLVEVGKTVLSDMFGGLDFTKAQDLEIAIQKIVDTVERWIDLTAGIVQGIAPFLEKVAELAGMFSELDESTVKNAGELTGWGKVINVVAGFIPNLTAPLGLLSASIGVLSLTQIPGMITSLLSLGPVIGGLGTILGPVTLAVGAFAAAWKFGDTLQKEVPVIRAAGDAAANLALSIFGLDEKTISAKEASALHTLEMGKAAVEAVRLAEAIEAMNNLATPKIKVETDFDSVQSDFDAINDEIEELITRGEILITADVSQAEAELKRVSDWQTIFVEGGEPIVIPVGLDGSGAVKSAEDTKKKIDEKLPSEKLMEIQLQGDIDIELERIKSTAETIQTAFEWEAKVEIAEIEAQAQQVEAIATSLSEMFKSTGEVISAALGVIGSVGPGSPAFRVIEDALEADLAIRKDLAAAEIKLTEQQILFMKARTESLRQGKSLLTINAEGLSAELAMVLEKIIQLAQVQANTEGFTALLGM